MSKNDDPSDSGKAAEKSAAKGKRTRKTLVRKTRYLALEPRIVFDGALAADIVDKNTQTPADASKSVDSAAAVADKTLPAVDWTQTTAPVAATADGKAAAVPGAADKAVADATAADRAAADKAAEAANKAIGDRALASAFDASLGSKELVFVDTSVSGYQALMQDIVPGARVVVLDSTRDAVGQIADVLAQLPPGSVDAVHLIARGSEGQIDFGTGALNSATIGGAYAADLAKIGQGLSAGARIVVHGNDFGTGKEGGPAADALAKATGADVLHADALPQVPVAAPSEVVFLDTSVPDYQTLLANIDSPNARVVLIDGSRDPLDQMASYLDGLSGLDAIHVISHGTSGDLILAGRNYTADILSQQYSIDLARIGHALAPQGDILLYGCDIAEGSAGQRFIDQVAKMTGADIAASTDLTGATDLGGNWVLEARTGQIDAPSLFSQMQDQWGFLLNVPSINIGGATLSFNDANRTLVSGTDKAVGAVYKYANVATIPNALGVSTQIDAYVTITGITNASITTVDQDAPTGYVPPTNTKTGQATSAVDPFAPEIVTTAAGGHVDFTFDFKDPAGNSLTLFNFASNSIDIDGAGTPGAYQEFDEYGGFQSYTVGNPTDLIVSPGVINTNQLRFTGSNAYNGLVVNDVGRVQANFNAVSTLTISFGATGSTGGTARQYGDLFAAVSFANPDTVYVPTVDQLTTIDNQPTLTGTIDGTQVGAETSLASGESFSVTVAGTTYTTSSGVTIDATGHWSLTLPTPLGSGVYDVTAVRTTSSGLPLPDQSTHELVINNAPVLNDTPLS